MAPLPFTFNPFAVGARAALDEGKREAAKQLMLEHLRLTNHPFYEIAAELLSKKSKQGPRKILPSDWFEIGNDFLQLTERIKKPLGYDKACAVLARKWKRSQRTIRKTLGVFNRGRR